MLSNQRHLILNEMNKLVKTKSHKNDFSIICFVISVIFERARKTTTSQALFIGHRPRWLALPPPFRSLVRDCGQPLALGLKGLNPISMTGGQEGWRTWKTSGVSTHPALHPTAYLTQSIWLFHSIQMNFFFQPQKIFLKSTFYASHKGKEMISLKRSLIQYV